MKIELHVLQNFAPSNLNRDDTGAPKDCEFGGVRRARISSQCFKRAIREAFIVHDLLGEGTREQMAARTKRLVDKVAEILKGGGKDEARAKELVAFALGGADLKVVDENKTQYLLFVPRRAIQELAKLVAENWDSLDGAAPKSANGNASEAAAESGKKGKAKSKAQEKSAAKDAVPKEVKAAIAELLRDVSKTPDLALFGRMIADSPEWNTEAACQVAQAISTNRVSMEFDFYTAVDDLKPKDTAGSDMMGTVSFQSACFYRYACLDVAQLRENLAGDDKGDVNALTRSTIEAFLRASALAIPTGKQNSMAAQNRPSYLLASVRTKGAPQSLANAFVKPIRPSQETSLVEASRDALESYLDRSLAMWGDSDLKLFACSELESADKKGDRVAREKSFDAWVKSVVDAGLGGAS